MCGPVPGIAAAVTDDPAEAEIVRHGQAEAVATGAQRWVPSADARSTRIDRPVDLLHVASAGPGQRMPVRSSRGGNASANPPTQRPRSRTDVNRPPMAAFAYGRSILGHASSRRQ